MRVRGHAGARAAATWLVWALMVHAPATHAATARDVAHSAAGRDAAAPDTSLTFPRFFDALSSLQPDSARVANVASVQITREAGVFVLQSGTLALCRPVAGTTCAAVFTGRGTFLFTPPAGVERDQLERSYGRRSLRREFQSLVLLFSDTTLAEFQQVAEFKSAAVPKSLRDLVRDILPFLVSTETHAVAPRVAKPLLDPVRGGLFVAAMNGADGALFFAIDPQQAERVELLRQPDNDRYGVMVRHGLEIVSRFPAIGDTLAMDSDALPPVVIRHTALAVTLGTDLGLRVVATLELESMLDGQRWLPFRMPSGAAIESAAWDGGAPVPHWNWNGNPVLWARCDPPLAAGERRRLRIQYRARVLDRDKDVIYNHAASGCVPATRTPDPDDIRPDVSRAVAISARRFGPE